MELTDDQRSRMVRSLVGAALPSRQADSAALHETNVGRQSINNKNERNTRNQQTQNNRKETMHTSKLVLNQERKTQAVDAVVVGGGD